MGVQWTLNWLWGRTVTTWTWVVFRALSRLCLTSQEKKAITAPRRNQHTG